MRKLKRGLALVLPLTLALALIAVAGAAGRYDGAVEALAELKVLQGRGEEDGMAANEPVTRAEMATILYRIQTGDVDGGDLPQPTWDVFTDVRVGQWHAAAVSYCVDKKVIRGHGDGTFGPNDPVTGYQAVAMLLRVLNYDNGSSFTDESWEEETARFGDITGITSTVAAAELEGNASRELVAQLTYQALAGVALAEAGGSNQSTGTTLGRQVFGLPPHVEAVPTPAVGTLLYLMEATPLRHEQAEAFHAVLIDGRAAVISTSVGLAYAPQDSAGGGMGGQPGMFKVSAVGGSGISAVTPVSPLTAMTWVSSGVLAATDPVTGADYITLADNCRAYRIDGTKVSPVELTGIKNATGYVAAVDGREATVLYLVG